MPNSEFWKKTNAAASKAVRAANGKRASAGLEIEAGFEVWLAFLRQHLGSSYAWDRPFTSDLEQVNAIDAETSLLLKIAPEWSAEEFYSACVTADPDSECLSQLVAIVSAVRARLGHPGPRSSRSTYFKPGLPTAEHFAMPIRATGSSRRALPS